MARKPPADPDGEPMFRTDPPDPPDDAIEYLEEIEWTDTRWRLNRSTPGRPRELGPHLTTGTGPLTEAWVFENYGGGDYVIGYKRPGDGGWRRTYMSLEGPQIVKQHPSFTPANAPASADPLVELKKQLEAVRLESQIATLRAELVNARGAGAPAASADPIAMLERAAALMDRFRPAGGGETLNPFTAVESTLGLIERIGKSARRGEVPTSSAGDSWPETVREVLPQVLGLISQMFPGPGGVSRTLTETGPTTPQPPQDRKPEGQMPSDTPNAPDGAARLAMVVSMLEGAYNRGVPADELADAAETMLGDRELADLKGTPEPLVFAVLDRVSDRFRDDPTASAEVRAEAQKRRDYVKAFLVELKRPDEPGAGAGGG